MFLLKPHYQTKSYTNSRTLDLIVGFQEEHIKGFGFSVVYVFTRVPLRTTRVHSACLNLLIIMVLLKSKRLFILILIQCKIHHFSKHDTHLMKLLSRVRRFKDPTKEVLV